MASWRSASGEHLFEIDKFGPHGLHLGGNLRHRLELGIVAARLDEGIAFELARGHTRFEFGEAMGDLVETFGGNGHACSGADERQS